MQTQQLNPQQAPQARSLEPTREGTWFVPRTDIYETKEAVELVMEVPGADDTTVDITLEQRVLTVEARASDEVPGGYSLAYSEYRTGNYRRAFTLSMDVDRDAIRAVVKDGVLRLTLPKAQAAKQRRIDVRAG